MYLLRDGQDLSDRIEPLHKRIWVMRVVSSLLRTRMKGNKSAAKEANRNHYSFFSLFLTADKLL